jgi:nucleoside-specific outer membrane channel protein Tsx
MEDMTMKKILVASGLAVAGISVAVLILRKSKKNKKDKSKKNPEIELWDLDDFDTDLEEDLDDDIDDEMELSNDEDIYDLSLLTDDELSILLKELKSELGERLSMKCEEDKKLQEEAGCRSR